MTTFSELRIPFPLFEGRVEDASEYVGEGVCIACGEQAAHCFELGIGADVIIGCPKCGAENGLDADDAADQECRACGTVIEFPAFEDERVVSCYACLRAGRAAITKDTRLGIITWDQAVQGVTHGVPGLHASEFEPVPLEAGWVGARLPREEMHELLRTPTYVSFQGERWEFCCKKPMVYIGTWTQQDFETASTVSNGRALFEEVVQDIVEGLWEGELHDSTGVYVFRCGLCGRRTANWDIA